MNIKGKIIVVIFCIIVICVYIISNNYNLMTNEVTKVYNVYLDGEIIGVISSDEELYSLIDQKQKVVKDTYEVDNVYPPNGLEVVEAYVYNPELTPLDDVYEKIEELQDFTIYGYEIKVGKTSNHEAYSIYVLDKQVFNDALEQFILAFIDEEDYYNYINNTQEEIEYEGISYTNMKFQEEITIKEEYISSNETIYTDASVLAQDILFGFDYEEKSYTVKLGDTIESISEGNKLNVQEFLIANPNYSSKDSLLAVDEVVNITLIDPILAFEYTVYEIKEEESVYGTTYDWDYSQPASYYTITTPGVNGLALITRTYSVVNGEQSQGVETVDTVVIREKVDQVITRGISSGVYGKQIWKDTGTGWTWPTQDYYSISSKFAWRWGRQHNGIDISGTGYGSNIYAANDGTVVYVNKECANYGTYGSSCGGGYGNYVVIDHGNNVYTLYGHLTNKIVVKVGQKVTKKQLIGYMGSSGSSTGVHLHFGVSIGDPLNGGTYFNPEELY